MKPTNDDLARLIPEAKVEAQAGVMPRESSDMLGAASIARDTMATAVLLLMQSVVDWPNVRRTTLRALHLCALIAWEAGKRMAPQRVAMPPAWLVSDGGTLKPVEGPTAAETPAAKHDVEALLEEAAKHITGAKAPWSAAGVIERLAAALRAARERADAMTEKSCKDWESRRVARSHLRAVLEFMWPGDTGGPTVVQKARAFLAGEEQAPRHDDAREIELLRKELADKGAALERMHERYERATTDLSRMTNDRNEWKAVAEAIGPTFQNDLTKLRSQLATEQEAHKATRAGFEGDTAVMHTSMMRDRAELAKQDAELTKAQADLRAEDEAHAHTKASLAAAAREVERLQDVAQKALATQNRAESEAAGLRAQLADLETAIRAIVDRVEKGRA